MMSRLTPDREKALGWYYDQNEPSHVHIRELLTEIAELRKENSKMYDGWLKHYERLCEELQNQIDHNSKLMRKLDELRARGEVRARISPEREKEIRRKATGDGPHKWVFVSEDVRELLAEMDHLRKELKKS